MDESIEPLLSFWFDPEPETPGEVEGRMRRWFEADPDLDAEIAARFAGTAERAARGELADWAGRARGRLALILLLDQVPRHLHRGSAAAFATDDKALELTITGIEAGLDVQLPVLQRGFFYMPLQHAEDAAAQAQSVERFEALRNDPGVPAHLVAAVENFAHHARMHRDIVVRFGRFPHRNRALGRADTPAEQEFLRGGGPRFGQ